MPSSLKRTACKKFSQSFLITQKGHEQGQVQYARKHHKHHTHHTTSLLRTQLPALLEEEREKIRKGRKEAREREEKATKKGDVNFLLRTIIRLLIYHL